MEHRVGRRLLALAAIFALSGCSLSSGIPVGPRASSATMQRPGSNGGLLYVANESAADGVDILTFPQGKRVGNILNIGAPQGVCADLAGHRVWVTAYLGPHAFALYAFAHGATTPEKTVHRKGSLRACAVDPKGNVSVIADQISAYSSTIATWRPSLDGKPQLVDVGLSVISMIYDPLGNLYLKGYEGSDPAFAMLPKGSTKLTWLTGVFDFDSALGWDGTYVTLGGFKRGSVIFRLTISGKTVKVSSVIRLNELSHDPQYALVNEKIVATRGGDNVKSVGLYDYPTGGKPSATFQGFKNPIQMAISPP